MKKVICISGKAQNGKDTTASILKDVLEERDNRVLIFHYADLLKYLCKQYFGWDGEKDDAGRTLLQHVGTDIIRAQDPNYWVNFAVNFLKMFEGEWDYVLIPDCRFPNEINTMETHFDCMHLRIVRGNFESPLTPEQQNHPSETALDDYPYDDVIHNDGTISDLKISLNKLVEIIDN